MAQDPRLSIMDRSTKEGRTQARLADLERQVEKLSKATPTHVTVTSGPPSFTPAYTGSPAYDKVNNRWYLWTTENGWKSVAMA